MEQLLTPQPRKNGAKAPSKIDIALSAIDAVIEKKPRFELKTAAEIEAAAAPVSWIIKKIIPSKGVGCLIGPPGAGKSFLMLAWAVSIALGIKWNGYRVRRGRVLYIAAEGQAGVSNRLRALKQVGLDIKCADIHFHPKGLDFFGAECDQFAAQMEEEGQTFDFIVVDTLHRVSGGGDENAAKDFGVILASADNLRTKTGGGFLMFTHHPGHGDKSRGRGTSAQLGAWDVEWVMGREEKGAPYILRNTKTKDGGVTGEDNFEIKLKVIELLTLDGSPMLDEDGDPVTSCVIESRVADGIDLIRDEASKALLSALCDAQSGLSRADLRDVLIQYEKDSPSGKQPSKQSISNKLTRKLDEMLERAVIRKVGDGNGALYYPADSRAQGGGYAEF